MAKQRLGRGLDILLPQTETFSDATVRDIPIAEIDPNLSQPRKAFDADALEQLAQSIKQSGLLQPILVVEEGSRFRIIAGERRYRACRMAGLPTIPCLVRDFTETEQLEAALLENIQREDLNPIEEAQAIQSLIKQCDYTQENAARRLGKSRSAIANQLRLLSLPEAIQQMLITGDLSAGHARVLAGIAPESRQLELAHLTVLNGYNVRKLEALAKVSAKPAVTSKARTLSNELMDFKDTLREATGVKTELVGNESKGKIIFSYGSSEELEHLYDVFSHITR